MADFSTIQSLTQNQFKNFHQRTKGDKVIWGLIVLLVLFSLLAVYSATGSLAYQKYKGNTEIYLFKQIAFIVFGLIVIYFAHLVKGQQLQKMS